MSQTMMAVFATSHSTARSLALTGPFLPSAWRSRRVRHSLPGTFGRLGTRSSGSAAAGAARQASRAGRRRAQRTRGRCMRGSLGLGLTATGTGTSLFVARGGARRAVGLDVELAQVELTLDLALDELEPGLQLAQLGLEGFDAGGHVVARPRAGDLGVAELPLQGREQEQRVASAVGPRDLAFLVAQ